MSYAVNGILPAGLTFDTVTGVLTGTPTSAGDYTNISFTAINASGNDTTNTDTLVVTDVPVFGFRMTTAEGWYSSSAKPITNNAVLDTAPTKSRHFRDYNGAVTLIPNNEIVMNLGRRVDNSNSTDYGWGTPGIQYFDTDAVGSPLTDTPYIEVNNRGSNLHRFSSDVSSAIYVPLEGTVQSRSDRDPDGYSLSHRYVPSTNNVQGHILRAIMSSYSMLNATNYTFSVFARSEGLKYLVLRPLFRFADAFAYFDLINGVTGSAGTSVGAHGMEDVGNGWYRCWWTAISNATGSQYVIMQPSPNDQGVADPLFSGSGVNGIGLHGVQVELAATSTSPPTGYNMTVDTESLDAESDELLTVPENYNDDVDHNNGTLLAKFISTSDSNLFYGLIGMGAVEYAGIEIASTVVGARFNDGTNIITNDEPFAPGDTVTVCAIWDSSTLLLDLGISVNGAAWVWGTTRTFDGQVFNVSGPHIAYELSRPQKILEAHSTMGLVGGSLATHKTWLADNY